MSTGDGRVLGVTKIVDHGPDEERWNVTILGDGYKADQMAKYHDDVRQFLNVFRGTAPFDALWCGLNVHRVDVVSTDEGADKPAGCGGSGSTRDTYFDATYCHDGVLQRLLTIDSDLAQDTAEDHVPLTDVAMVIVNDSDYGGSGGDVVVFAAKPDSIDIALHELGHTAFGLADEYSFYEGCNSAEVGHDIFNDEEPAEPNVTKERLPLKWSGLITAANVPTLENPDCTTAFDCEQLAADPEPGRVGAYEGARYFHCGLYRPQFDCRMRIEAAQFCAVCQQAIRDRLSVYLPEATIELSTPSLEFRDIPEGIGGAGVTTYRAIVFEVVTCLSKTLRVTGPRPAGFTLPNGDSATVGPAEADPVNHARLWIAYTSTNAGDRLEGTLTVECDETGERWEIELRANTVARPKSALTLVLDRSGSMGDAGRDGTLKIEMLREAAKLVVDVMLEGDALGITAFNSTASTLLAMTDVGPAGVGAGRAAAIAAIEGNGLDPARHTSIGAGLEEAETVFAEAATGLEPFEVEATLVMSDGKQNRPPYIAEVADLVTANTFAVGLGEPHDIDADALQALTEDTGGYLLLTGGIDDDQEHRLRKYFLQILAGVSNAEVVLDPPGSLAPRAEHRLPFHLTQADFGVDVILASRYARYFTFSLQAPEGTVIDAPSVRRQHVGTERVQYFRLPLPLRLGSGNTAGAGRWQALLRLTDAGKDYVDVIRKKKPKAGPEADVARSGALPYDVMVHAYSALRFNARVLNPHIAFGESVTLTAHVQEFDAPPARSFAVVADMIGPERQRRRIQFTHEGEGRCRAVFVPGRVGLYTARIQARGIGAHGAAYTRERTLSFVVSKQGPDKSPLVPPRPGELASLLERLKNIRLLNADELKELEASLLKQVRYQLLPPEPMRRRKRSVMK